MRVEKFQFQPFEHVDSVTLGGFRRTGMQGLAQGMGLPDFGQPDTPPPPADTAPAEPAKTHTDAEVIALVERARREAYEQGKADGIKEGEAKAEQQVSAAVSAKDKMLQATLDTLTGRLTEAAEAGQHSTQHSIGETVKLALAMALKIAGHALHQASIDAIEPHIIEVLSSLHGEQEAAIIVAPDLASDVQEMLDRITGQSGFRGMVTVHTDPAMPPGDCKVQWQHGEAVRDMEALLDEVNRIAERYCSAEEMAHAAHAALAPHAPDTATDTPEADTQSAGPSPDSPPKL